MSNTLKPTPKPKNKNVFLPKCALNLLGLNNLVDVQ